MPTMQDRWEDFMKRCILKPCGLLSFPPSCCRLPCARLLLGFLLLLMNPALFPVLPILLDTELPIQTQGHKPDLIFDSHNPSLSKDRLSHAS